MRDAEPSPASVHPTESELQRFMHGELMGGEARAVVRHLLAGCETCRAVTRRLWSFGDLPGEGGERMNEIEAAQEEIRKAVQELKRLERSLLGVVSSLPPSPAEAAPLADVEPTDPRTGIRSVVECVLNDSLAPAIRDLEEVAGLPAARAEEG